MPITEHLADVASLGQPPEAVRGLTRLRPLS
jgi:hypothetical protein